jgi:hypothetical protein
MTKTILVTESSGDEFKIEVPETSSLTFGPFSPPTKNSDRYGADAKLAGTLRVYAGAKASAAKVLAVFTNVASFRDLSEINLIKKIAVEEGATLWKSDAEGYSRVDKVQRAEHFEDEDLPLLEGNVVRAAADAATELF